MAQINNSGNWILKQDVNGQKVLQIVQAVPTTSKSINGAVGGQPVQMFRAVVTKQEGQQQGMTTNMSEVQAQVIKSFKPNMTAQGYPRTADGKVIARAVKLTPQQMQNVKFIPQTPKQQFNRFTPSSSEVSRKRPESFDQDFTPDNKRRKPEKIGKGLRHFSMKVCEKVKEKKVTTYNEVADELVNEFAKSAKNDTLADQYDQKNIRRRVYDALNVLMAMNIIRKEKKEIRWLGLPSNAHQEYANLEQEKKRCLQSIREKTRVLQELIMNQISFKSLAARNKQHEVIHGIPSQNSYIQLPFIVVNTNKKTIIDCSISHDKMEYHFHFNDKFEIMDDLDVLKKIGMLRGLDTGECSPEDVAELKQLIPESLREYVDQLASGSLGMDQFADMIPHYPVAAADPNTSDMDDQPGSSSQQEQHHQHQLHEFIPDDLVETTYLEDDGASRHSSNFDPLSPSGTTGDRDYSSDEDDDILEEEEPMSEDLSSEADV